MTHDTSVNEYLSALRLSLAGGPVPELSEEAGAIASRQSTRALLTSDFKFLTNVRILHKLQEEAAGCLLDAFDKEGIEAVVVKGAAVAGLYPEPYRREYGDIDILVRTGDFERACTITSALLGVDNPEMSEHHAHFVRLPIIVEIHPGVQCGSENFGRRYNLDEDLWFGTASCHKLDPTLNVYYIFSHLCTHFINGGVGMRHLCDWYVAMLAEGADAGRAAGMLHDRHERFYWQLLGWCLVEYLGFPADRMPLYDPRMKRRGRMALRHILRVGNFGKARNAGRRSYLARFFGARGDCLLFARMVAWRDGAVFWSRILRIFRSYRLEEACRHEGK